jgi:hypothetical protein
MYVFMPFKCTSATAFPFFSILCVDKSIS